MRKFRLRRLEKVNIEALLVASGQNVKRLLAFGGRRPKKLAQAAALRPPIATGDEISHVREHRSSRSWWPTKAFFNSLDRFRKVHKWLRSWILSTPDTRLRKSSGTRVLKRRLY